MAKSPLLYKIINFYYAMYIHLHFSIFLGICLTNFAGQSKLLNFVKDKFLKMPSVLNFTGKKNYLNLKSPIIVWL